MGTYFSDHFSVDPKALETYGAFDICLITDLPLFVDPFLLFNSEKPKYQKLHEQIISYLEFLRDKSVARQVDQGSLQALYYFKEVKQNCFGFTAFGHDGHGLGPKFADSLNRKLGLLFGDPDESITEGKHMEKLTLINDRVGRDNISDFTTVMIQGFLLDYTEKFTKTHVPAEHRDTFRVSKAIFNYRTETWQEKSYILPRLEESYVLLTPEDMLTRDETWINRHDLIRGFERIPPSVGDAQLRSQINTYFRSRLKPQPKQRDRDEAATATIIRFPVLLDYFIAQKEAEGDQARDISKRRVADVDLIFVKQLKKLIDDLTLRTDIRSLPQTSYEEALARVHAFKDYVENKDGYRLINRNGQAFSNEPEVQLYFGLALYGSQFDVNREPNNGRGPVDFSVSIGAADKTLIEFKLGGSSSLERNLQKQVDIYEKANNTKKSVKVIVVYNGHQAQRVRRILRKLKLEGREDVVVIDARSDNKPSASKA